MLKLSECLNADRIESVHSDRGAHPVRSFDAWEAEKKLFSVSLGGNCMLDINSIRITSSDHW